MTKRNMIIGGLIILAIIAAITLNNFLQLRSLTKFPTSVEAGVSFQTIQSGRPEGSGCLNEIPTEGLAKELINLESRTVILGIGEGSMPDDEWAQFEPSLPIAKNINRNVMFDSDCFYRSPGAPVDCEGEACRITEEFMGYEWMELSAIDSQDCLPVGETGCGQPDLGVISVTVTRKCHQIIFEDEIYDLADPAGNRYVMHANATGTPDLSVVLPEGWTLEKVMLDEPLEVLPFGGGDNCYHNVLRDNLGQGYHQYIFAGETYP